MSKSKWYAQGYADALNGFFDPPWQKGHRDHTRYCEGHADALRQLEHDAERERYETARL